MAHASEHSLDEVYVYIYNIYYVCVCVCFLAHSIPVVHEKMKTVACAMEKQADMIRSILPDS